MNSEGSVSTGDELQHAILSRGNTAHALKAVGRVVLKNRAVINTWNIHWLKGSVSSDADSLKTLVR